MITDAVFSQIRDIVYDACRIDLRSGKRDLVEARLKKRLRALGIADFETYMAYLADDHSGQEMQAMLDVLTTNLTYFFREPEHFDYLSEFVRSRVSSSSSRRVRIWSAGCSSGEEPYTIAIVLSEVRETDATDIKILATDICSQMVATAREGTYPSHRTKGVSPALLAKYFNKIEAGGSVKYSVCPDLRRLVTFRQHNLAGPWPMKGPFDAIMCRNVMIYFDRSAQEELVSRFASVLAPGGVLLVGHSESLTGIRHGLRYVKPSIYVKPS